MGTEGFKGILLSTLVIASLLTSVALLIPSWPPLTSASLVVRGVDVSISPSYQAGVAGATLNYIVTISNTGNVDENYNIRVSDNENWPITYWFNFINLPGYSSAQSELIVTIPEDVPPCVRDNITVTATSWDNVVSDSDSCIAHRAKAEFSLVTLYKVRLDVDFYFATGSRLVVKFYTYGGAYEGENIVWSGTTPDTVIFSEIVPHPGNEPIENATLVLTDNAGNVITTITSFVVHRSDLMKRIAEIDMLWPYASLEERSVLMAEIAAIDVQWPYAPP